MSFLDNFSFAFQDIIIETTTSIINEYGEKEDSSPVQKSFKGIISEKGSSFGENFLDSSKLLAFTSKEYELYSKIDVLPTKKDKIISNENIFEIIFIEKIYINNIHDHNKSILRLIN